MKLPKTWKKKAQKLGRAGLAVLLVLFAGYHILSFSGVFQELNGVYKAAQASREASTICTDNPDLSLQLRHAQQLTAANNANHNPNLIPNSALTQFQAEAPNLPEGWSQATWGNSGASFAFNWQPNSNSNSLSVSVTSSDNTAGAGWGNDPIPATGSYYLYADSYKSTAPSLVAFHARLKDGTDFDTTIKQVSPSAGWSDEVVEVFVPANATNITVNHILSQAGTLDTKNFSLKAADVAGFSQGLVSVSFDDGWRGIYTTAYPLIKQYRLRTTQFIIADNINYPLYMTDQQIKTMAKNGQEIEAHSLHHDDQTTLSADKLAADVRDSKIKLRNYNSKLNLYASPYGHYNDATLSAISHCYVAHRTTDFGYNSTVYDPMRLKVQNIDAGTTEAQLQSWLQYARDHHVWLILVYHDVDDQGTKGFTINTQTLNDQFKAISKSGLKNVTIGQGLQLTASAQK